MLLKVFYLFLFLSLPRQNNSQTCFFDSKRKTERRGLIISAPFTRLIVFFSLNVKLMLPSTFTAQNFIYKTGLK